MSDKRIRYTQNELENFKLKLQQAKERKAHSERRIAAIPKEREALIRTLAILDSEEAESRHSLESAVNDVVFYEKAIEGSKATAEKLAKMEKLRKQLRVLQADLTDHGVHGA